MEEEGGNGVFGVIAPQNLIGEVVALVGWVGWVAAFVVKVDVVEVEGGLHAEEEEEGTGAIDAMGQVVALEEDHGWVAASGMEAQGGLDAWD